VQITWHYAKRALQAGATLLVGLSSASGVWAQCTDTFATFGNNIPAPGQTRPVQELLPELWPKVGDGMNR